MIAARGRATLFLGKSELVAWPLIGPILRHSGMIFVNRKSLFSRAHSLLEIQKRIQAGCDVVIFPEGTTSLEGPLRGVRSYFAGAFRVSRMESIPIELMHLAYSDPERVSFLGEDNFVSHLNRLVNGTKIHVKIRSIVLPPVSDRRDQRSKHADSRRWLLEGGTNLISCLSSLSLPSGRQ